MHRRAFLRAAPMALLAGKSLLAQSTRVSSEPESERALLTHADLQYRGCFRMPSAMPRGGGDPNWGEGLAHRYVDGTLRFFHRSLGGGLYEVVAPELQPEVGASLTATVHRVWGPVWRGDAIGTVHGVYWDDVDRRLYWAAGESYNTQDGFQPSIGYCELNDEEGTFTKRGVWAFKDRSGRRSCKMVMGGLLAVPEWFSSRYASGRRLGAGFGGNFSIATTGPISMGPALSAFNPDDLAKTRSKGTVDSTTLLGYPFHQGRPYSNPQRAHRDTDYRTEFDGWNPRNGVGYWSGTDTIWQGGVWVDTPRKTGVLMFATLGNGRTWYANSTINAERSSHVCFLYAPEDLALVAQRKKDQWEIQPREEWAMQYPGALHPLPGWFDGPPTIVTGVTFDRSTDTLYVAVRFALGMEEAVPKHTVVFAYGIA